MGDEDAIAGAVSRATALAVVQTTQADHERRIAILEASQSKLMFWLMTTTVSSMAVILTQIVSFITGKH